MAGTPPSSVASSGAIAQLYDNVASGAIASWDVTGLSQAYTHLRIIVSGRGTTAATAVDVKCRFNADTGAHYDWQYVRGVAAAASAAESFGDTGAYLGQLAAASAVADTAGMITADVANYTGTTFSKSVQSAAATVRGITTGTIIEYFVANGWRDTSAISRVTIYPSAGNFAAGSRLSIYGIL